MELNNLVQLARQRVNNLNLAPDTDLGKLVYKSPVLLWRLGLGPVIGHAMLILTTTGRNTGLLRRVALEYRTLHSKCYVINAYGDSVQWYQNIQADPFVTLQTSRGSESAKAVRVDNEVEILSILQEFKRYNPFFISWYLKLIGLEDNEQELLEHKDRLCILRFDPVNQLTPPALEVDLAWLWPLMMLLKLLSPRRRKRK